MTNKNKQTPKQNPTKTQPHTTYDYRRLVCASLSLSVRYLTKKRRICAPKYPNGHKLCRGKKGRTIQDQGPAIFGVFYFIFTTSTFKKLCILTTGSQKKKRFHFFGTSEVNQLSHLTWKISAPTMKVWESTQ